MNSMFSTWSQLSKHAGAMLMAPSMLAIVVVAFAFFSWNKQTVEEVPLLDLVMEVRVDLEHAHLLLFQVEKELKSLQAIQGDALQLQESHDRLIEGVDNYFATMQMLKSNVATLQKGTATMGAVTLSDIEVKQVSDDELSSRVELLTTMVEELDEHLRPELEEDAYQSFSYSMVDAELFAEAIKSAAFCDERIHALIKEGLVPQRRLFLLLLVVFTLVAGYMFIKWRKLNREQESCLADIYLTSQATEQATDPLLILSASGVIEYANLRFYEHSGLACDAVIGKPVTDLSIDENSWVAQALTEASSGRQWQGETRMLNIQGDGYHCSVTVSPLMDRTLSPSFVVLRQQLS